MNPFFSDVWFFSRMIWVIYDFVYVVSKFHLGSFLLFLTSCFLSLSLSHVTVSYSKYFSHFMKQKIFGWHSLFPDQYFVATSLHYHKFLFLIEFTLTRLLLHNYHHNFWADWFPLFFWSHTNSYNTTSYIWICTTSSTSLKTNSLIYELV